MAYDLRDVVSIRSSRRNWVPFLSRDNTDYPNFNSRTDRSKNPQVFPHRFELFSTHASVLDAITTGSTDLVFFLIHAFLMECDRCLIVHLRLIYFNSRIPCRMRWKICRTYFFTLFFQFTYLLWDATFPLFHSFNLLVISIHASHAECDSKSTLPTYVVNRQQFPFFSSITKMAFFFCLKPLITERQKDKWSRIFWSLAIRT